MKDLQPALQRLRLAIEDASVEERAAAADEERLARELAATLSACPSGSSTPAAGAADKERPCACLCLYVNSFVHVCEYTYVSVWYV